MKTEDAGLTLAGRIALRPKEAAAALGLSERTFRALLPRIPHVRLEGAVLVPVDLLRRWLEDRAKAPGMLEDRIVAETLDGIRKHNNR